MGTSSPSTLLISAINLNQLVHDKLFRYALPISWNTTSHSFNCLKKPSKLIPWLIVTFLVFPWIAINSSVILALYANSSYLDLNILQIFLIISQLLIIIVICVNGYDILSNADNWALFLNCVMKFQCTHPPSSENHLSQSHFSKTNSPWKIGRLQVNIRDKNGYIDTYGIFMMAFVLGCMFIELVLPVFTFLWKLDAPYHFLKVVLPPHWYDSTGSGILIQAVRVFIGTWAICQGVNAIRYAALNFFIFLQSYRNFFCILQTTYPSYASIKGYKALTVLFSLISGSLSVELPVFFGITYWVLVLVQTISVLELKVLDWKFYISIAFGGLFGTIMIMLAWEMTILVNEHSKKVKLAWTTSLFEKNRKWESCQKKMLVRMVRSLRQIAISYGELGSITKATRASYMYSMMTDTVQLIIAIRKSGYKA